MSLKSKISDHPKYNISSTGHYNMLLLYHTTKIRYRIYNFSLGLLELKLY